MIGEKQEKSKFEKIEKLEVNTGVKMQ